MREFSAKTTDDPRILIGQAGLRQVCGRLYLRLGNEGKALEQAETAPPLQLRALPRDPGKESAAGMATAPQIHAFQHRAGPLEVGSKRARAEARFKLAGELQEQDPSDSSLQSDYGNALFGYADILLNVKDPALKDWAKAHGNFAAGGGQYQPAGSASPRPVCPGLATEQSRPGGSFRRVGSGKAFASADRQTALDKETAREIEFEVQKLKLGAVGSGPGAGPDRPKKKVREWMTRAKRLVVKITISGVPSGARMTLSPHGYVTDDSSALPDVFAPSVGRLR